MRVGPAGLGRRAAQVERRGVGTDSEFTCDASGWRWQRADASASDDATDRASCGLEFCAKSAKPPFSGRDVLPVIERQGAHAGSKAARRDSGAAATGRTAIKPAACGVRHAIAHPRCASSIAERSRQRPPAAAQSHLQPVGSNFVTVDSRRRFRRGARGA